MLCVVVPTYNEASNIQELLRSLFALNLTDLYVFVIDDSSPDGTAFIAEEMSSELEDRVFVFRRPNKMVWAPPTFLDLQKFLRCFPINVQLSI